MTLTLADILAVDDRKPTEVDVPEWGGTVNVYPLTASQIEEMERWWDENPAGVGWRLKLLSMALADLDASESDMRKLAGKSGAAIKRLVAVASELCDPKPIEELVGN